MGLTAESVSAFLTPNVGQIKNWLNLALFTQGSSIVHSIFKPDPQDPSVQSHAHQDSVFRLNLSFDDPLRQRLFSVVSPALERVLLFPQLNSIYHGISKGDSRRFVQSVIEALKVDYDIAAPGVARIPKEGSLVVVANHPFGVIEGLILAPVLLRQYLKLGAKFLGFSLDRSFGNVLDGLIMVDLTLTDRRLLDRFMGSEGAESFLAFHRPCS
jgi:hypothetical protein